MPQPLPAPAQAYCGNPPVPGAVAWNLDPLLLAVLAAIAATYLLAARHGPVPSRARSQALVLAGLAVVGFALVSPLCNLSVALFSARVGQHMLITLIGVPLIVAGGGDAVLGRLLPPTSALWARPDGTSPACGFGRASAGPAVFAVLFWFWHFGRPYDSTLQSAGLYWTMHLSLIAGAVLLWRAILSDNPMAGLAASFVTGLQMTVLGVLLTFAAHPWYRAHLGTAQAWGYSPMEDQQLGGLIMWVPGGMLLALHAIVVLGTHLSRLDASRPALRLHSAAGTATRLAR